MKKCDFVRRVVVAADQQQSVEYCYKRNGDVCIFGQGSRDTSIPDVSNSPFQEKYLTQERIGKGAYATIHRCTRRGDGKTFAVKNIDVRPMKLRDAFDPERLLREVKITQSLSHPHIVGLEETFWTRRRFKAEAFWGIRKTFAGA